MREVLLRIGLEEGAEGLGTGGQIYLAGRQVQRGLEGQTGFLSNLIIEIFSHHK